MCWFPATAPLGTGSFPSGEVLAYRFVEAREKPEELVPPRLPVRASIYIAPDGCVHFGALFAELVPVAAALGPAKVSNSNSTSTANSTSTSER